MARANRFLGSCERYNDFQRFPLGLSDFLNTGFLITPTHCCTWAANATAALGWESWDSSKLLGSRPEASWDGLHYLLTHDNIGGVSKVAMMAFVNGVLGC